MDGLRRGVGTRRPVLRPRGPGLRAVDGLSGDDTWLARARQLGDRAATAVRAESLRRDSLYKGEIGVAVFAADLSRPSESAMPFYDREGWPTSTG